MVLNYSTNVEICKAKILPNNIFSLCMIKRLQIGNCSGNIFITTIIFRNQEDEPNFNAVPIRFLFVGDLYHKISRTL